MNMDVIHYNGGDGIGTTTEDSRPANAAEMTVAAACRALGVTWDEGVAFVRSARLPIGTVLVCAGCLAIREAEHHAGLPGHVPEPSPEPPAEPAP